MNLERRSSLSLSFVSMKFPNLSSLLMLSSILPIFPKTQAEFGTVHTADFSNRLPLNIAYTCFHGDVYGGGSLFPLFPHSEMSLELLDAPHSKYSCIMFRMERGFSHALKVEVLKNGFHGSFPAEGESKWDVDYNGVFMRFPLHWDENGDPMIREYWTSSRSLYKLCRAFDIPDDRVGEVLQALARTT